MRDGFEAHVFALRIDFTSGLEYRFGKSRAASFWDGPLRIQETGPTVHQALELIFSPVGLEVIQLFRARKKCTDIIVP